VFTEISIKIFDVFIYVIIFLQLVRRRYSTQDSTNLPLMLNRPWISNLETYRSVAASQGETEVCIACRKSLFNISFMGCHFVCFATMFNMVQNIALSALQIYLFGKKTPVFYFISDPKIISQAMRVWN
jgi:hypothetical protein